MKVVPKTQKQLQSGRTMLTIAVPNQMAEKLDAMAASKFLPRSILVRQLIDAALRAG